MMSSTPKKLRFMDFPNNILWKLAMLFCMVAIATGCSNAKKETGEVISEPIENDIQMGGTWPNAVTYEIFVQSFYDTNNDGIGDFNGVTAKLDYLQDLGIEAIWLMPIHPSPSYHKYDVTDYREVHPDYGTMEDFKNLVNEAHKRDIRIVIDFVINHTGSDHPWFQASVKDKTGDYRDYYVWASMDEIQDKIMKEHTSADSDNRTNWHQAEGNEERYYGFFWGGMPDLNYDNPKVKEEIFDIGKFWLTEIGVDGFRLDAARHIFPDDRMKENHTFWEEFRAEMEKIKPNVYLIGEVWSSAEVVAPYLKGLPALFNFDIGYAISKSVLTEHDSSLVKNHHDIRKFYNTVTNEFIDATFNTNHDQNRIMSVVDGDLQKARMAASLLLTLPGAPYIYYGEEIGMLGAKPDEEIREPFVWDYEGKDPGQTKWREAIHSTDENVEPLSQQINDSKSLYNHYKELIHSRKSSPVLTFGQIEISNIKEDGIVNFYRVHEGDSLLVIHNVTGSEKALNLGESGQFNEILFQNHQGISLEEARLKIPGYSTIILTKG
ncbi:alpha-amylase family glycosyl hydrolase [Fulvivirgaceae bacterium BMA10]|uniref:Alpha-amylase family glycosyl hydrolase n=1 Tax=Splendidivirga corallicola TaxID=3051826 RepID=A0ABT8KV44_9BACT|nr:alpha-amylase family glycosyl hydrolase [Fulvivirgaceae bacterium BMA10]